MAYFINPLLAENLQKKEKEFKGQVIIKTQDGSEVDAEDIINSVDKINDDLTKKLDADQGLHNANKILYTDEYGKIKTIDGVVMRQDERDALINKQDKITAGDSIILKNNTVSFAGITNPDDDSTVTIIKDNKGAYKLSVKEALARLYYFKGSLATYEQLLEVENPKIGDVWNVESQVNRIEGGTYNNTQLFDKDGKYDIRLSLFKETETSYVVKVTSNYTLGGFGDIPFYKDDKTYYINNNEEFITRNIEEHQLIARIQSDTNITLGNYMWLTINNVYTQFLNITGNLSWADNKETILAGTNFAWTGDKWDALGGRIDLSVIVPKAILDSEIENEFDAIFN